MDDDEAKDTNIQRIIHRAEGITPSERFLKELCDHSFLRLWSYPGVYKNQTAGRGATGGKEVCDVLVVFENHVLIFSDKYCEFPETGDLDLDWSRWVRKSVLESAKQLYGAERWVKTHPDRLFIDRECKQPFPIELPNMTSARFHRLLVAHGVSERCKRELGGSGSLMIDSSVIGNDHLRKFEDGGMPFMVGQIDPKRGFVHIFDDTSLRIVLTTLDTISDFVGYLEKKELLLDKISIITTGEEELLAFYLQDLNENGDHDFIIPPNLDFLFLEEGIWEKFVRSSVRISQIDADKISYAWDALIDEFITHIMNDTQYYRYPIDRSDKDKVMRFLAREPRLRRRLLSKSLFDLMEKTPKSHKATRVMMPSRAGDPYYVFLLLPHLEGIPEPEYREVRRNLLEACLKVTKLTFPDAQDIVGIATETGMDEYRSEDAYYLDARIWTAEHQAESQSLQNDLGILQQIEKFAATEYEYPAAKRKSRKRHKGKAQ